MDFTQLPFLLFNNFADFCQLKQLSCHNLNQLFVKSSKIEYKEHYISSFYMHCTNFFCMLKIVEETNSLQKSEMNYYSFEITKKQWDCDMWSIIHTLTTTIRKATSVTNEETTETLGLYNIILTILSFYRSNCDSYINLFVISSKRRAFNFTVNFHIFLISKKFSISNPRMLVISWCYLTSTTSRNKSINIIQR